MKRIIHISDLHFGRERPAVIKALLIDLQNLKPDIIVISGDLTQRALKKEYLLAANFISQLKFKVICVPGNHDIPLYNFVERLFLPFYKYKKYINNSLLTTYFDDELAIVGINSATPFRWLAGKVNAQSLQKAQQFFQNHNDKIKIVIMHHNLIRSQRHKMMTNAEKILSELVNMNVNLILSGHLHHTCMEQIKREYSLHPMYVITAGTTTSNRLGSFNNSFNMFDIEEKQFIFSIREYQDNQFVEINKQSFSLLEFE